MFRVFEWKTTERKKEDEKKYMYTTYKKKRQKRKIRIQLGRNLRTRFFSLKKSMCK